MTSTERRRLLIEIIDEAMGGEPRMIGFGGPDPSLDYRLERERLADRIEALFETEGGT